MSPNLESVYCREFLHIAQKANLRLTSTPATQRTSIYLQDQPLRQRLIFRIDSLLEDHVELLLKKRTNFAPYLVFSYSAVLKKGYTSLRPPEGTEIIASRRPIVQMSLRRRAAVDPLDHVFAELGEGGAGGQDLLEPLPVLAG